MALLLYTRIQIVRSYGPLFYREQLAEIKTTHSGSQSTDSIAYIKNKRLVSTAYCQLCIPYFGYETEIQPIRFSSVFTFAPLLVSLVIVLKVDKNS